MNNTNETLKSDGPDYDTAREIIDKIKENLSSGSAFKLSVFKVEGLSVEIVSDRFTTRKISVVLPDCEDEEAEAMKLLPRCLNPSQLVCLGILLDFSLRKYQKNVFFRLLNICKPFNCFQVMCSLINFSLYLVMRNNCN